MCAESEVDWSHVGALGPVAVQDWFRGLAVPHLKESSGAQIPED